MLSTAELTFLHQNFTIAGGGTVTVRNVGGTGVYIRWFTRVLVTPLCDKASANYYNIECPTTGTIGTGQVNTSDGVSLGAPGNSYAALYYVLPTTQTADNALTPPRFTYSSAPGNFRLITYLNSSEDILPTYVLVAPMFSDPGQCVVNWAAGNVVLPTPDQDQSITWKANTQQLGRGANKIQLDGGTVM